MICYHMNGHSLMHRNPHGRKKHVLQNICPSPPNLSRLPIPRTPLPPGSRTLRPCPQTLCIIERSIYASEHIRTCAHVHCICAEIAATKFDLAQSNASNPDTKKKLQVRSKNPTTLTSKSTCSSIRACVYHTLLNTLEYAQACV